MSVLVNPHRFGGAALPIPSADLWTWIDVSDDDTCWQDATGNTTPAGNGDLVRVARSKDANGRHLYQYFVDAQRPTRRQTATGEWYLDFTGTENMAHDFSGNSADGVTEHIAVSQPNHVFVAGRHNAADGPYFYDGLVTSRRHALFTSSGLWFPFAGTGGTVNNSLDANDHVYSMLFNGASSQLRIDGVGGSTVDAGAHQMSGFTLGSRFNGLSKLVGRVYQFAVYSAAQTGSNLTDIEAFMASKMP